MSASPSSQKQKKSNGGVPRAGSGGESDDRRAHRRGASLSRFLLLSLPLLALSSLLLAAAQQADPALVDALEAATLAGEANNNNNAASIGGPSGAAFLATNSSDPAAAGVVLTEAERQARLDRALSFLSAGNIFVGNYQPYSRVIRRRVEEWVECRYNGTLTSRGVGIEESLPDVARLAFAFLGDTKEEVAGAALAAYAQINDAIAEAGFVGLAAALNAASSDVALSPIKFVLPSDSGESDSGNENGGSPAPAPAASAANNNSGDGGGGAAAPSNSNSNAAAGADGNPETPNPQYLVEVRVVLRSQDAPHLELGSSAALEAAVLAGGERFAASSSVFELSPLRLSQIFDAARVKANEDMLYALIADAAQLGVLLGPLDEYAPERRQQVTSAPDADAFDSLAAAGGGRPSRLFAVTEVAASYIVCSGGLEAKRGFVRIDEDGFDLGDLTSNDNSGN